MTAEYTTGETKFVAKITNEKDVTIDYVVNEANTMWKKVRSSELKFGDLESADVLMEKMRKEHPEFCKSYPIVLRYMCQMHEYSGKAFKTYLMKIKEHPYTSEEEYLESQADYVVILYKQRNKRWNNTQIANLRRNVLTLLQNEHEVFKKYVNEFDREVTAETEKLSMKSIEELHEFATLVGADGMKKAGTIRVETEIPSDNIPHEDLFLRHVDVCDAPTAASLLE